MLYNSLNYHFQLQTPAGTTLLSLAYWVLLLTCKQTVKIDQINVIVRHQYKIHFKVNLSRNIVHTVHTFLITQISTIRRQVDQPADPAYKPL